MPCQIPYRGDTQQMLLFKIASCLADGSFISGVSSFNGRTGVVTLTATDVSTALGCTPLCESDGDARYVLKSGDSMTGALSINNGVLVANEPALELSQTWNNAAVTFTGLYENITLTAASANSNLFNFQVNGSDRFNFTSGGTLRAIRQDASDAGVNFFLRKRGNAGDSNGAVAADSTIGAISYSGWDGIAFATGSHIDGLAAEAWTNLAHGSRINFYTTPVGSTTEQLSLQLNANGQARFLDGTAALPSLTFQSDPDTGMYRIGANNLALTTGGTGRLLINSAGEVATTGRAMIGNVDTGGFLSVFRGTSGAPAMTVQYNGAVSGDMALSLVLGTAVTGNFYPFYATGSTTTSLAAVIQQNGNGTASFFSLVVGTGDAVSQYGINGGQTWAVGLDNSDSDSFKISASSTLGSLDSISISTARVVTIPIGLVLSTAAPLSMASGANQRAGNLTLIGGTLTVANTSVTANTIILLTRKTAGGTIGTAISYTVIAATSFTVTSDSALDTSTFSYMLVEVP